MKKIPLACAAALGVIILDQLIKWWLLQLTDYDVHAEIVVTPFFNIVMVWNRGISFGMLAGHNQPFLLIAIALMIIIVLCCWLSKTENRSEVLAIGAVIGGAAGNIVDRLRFGAVADFFDFHAFGYHWPAFNIADSAIFMGVVVLCFRSMFSAPQKDGSP